MFSNKKIDILIPAYNCEKFIAKCLNSLTAQTYQNFNIIIVDDGSTDSTKSIIENFSLKQKNIKFYSKSNDNNISKTRNFLLEKITCDYFTFFDADDYAEPTYLELLLKNLILYNADISICKKQRHKETKNYKIKNPSTEIYFFNKNEAISEMISSKHFNGTVYCKLFKKSLLKNIKFNEKIHYGEDLEFCFKIMQSAKYIVYFNQKLYHYINHKNSIVTSKFSETKLTCVNCYDNIINSSFSNQTIKIAAKSMQGLIATELLFYIFRDKYKNKLIKTELKAIIKNSIPYIKKNKQLPRLLKLSPLVLWLTKFM